MLKTLLEDGRFAARAAEMGAVIQGEDAIAKACDAVEMRIPVRG